MGGGGGIIFEYSLINQITVFNTDNRNKKTVVCEVENKWENFDFNI